MDGGADVVAKPGQRQLLGPNTSAVGRRGLAYLHGVAGTGERQRAGEPVGPGADDDRAAAGQRKVWIRRKAFRQLIRKAIPHAAIVVRRLLTRPPITRRLLVNSTSGTSAKGIPNESTTWLITSARVGSTPAIATASAGAAVIARRKKTGIWRRMKPCITTWPASVPIDEDERPDASSATPSRYAAHLPGSEYRTW